MYRQVCSQLTLIVLLALQIMTSFNSNLQLAAQEYSVEQRIHIDGVYVERDAHGAEVYARVDRYSEAKLSPSKLEVGQPRLQPEAHNNQYNHHDHQTIAQAGQQQQRHQAIHGHQDYNEHYFVDQQNQHHHHHNLQQLHAEQQHLHQQQQQQQLHEQQQVHAAPQHRLAIAQPQLTHEGHQQQQDHQPLGQSQATQQQRQQQPQHPHHYNQGAQYQQQHQQQQQQQVTQQQHNHVHNVHTKASEPLHHEAYGLQHSHQRSLEYLYQQHHQQIQSHIHQVTQIGAWRSESIHEAGGSVAISEYVMHSFETSYPVVGGDHVSQHHGRSCEPIDDSSVLLMPSDFVLEPTCEATSASRFSHGAPDHVPKFASPHSNKPSQNSNIESFPLAAPHYQYDSSLMTAIRHYWREISGLCLVTAIFLNWLFVVVKRRFIGSGLARHSADVASSEQVIESPEQQRLSTSSSVASPPKSISKDTTSTFNNSAHDSAFEENASPLSLDDADDTSQESSLNSRPRSLSSTPIRLGVSQPSLNSSSVTSEYISRYSSDFDSIRRLGRGGFGIVFEAKNKIDDCHYAVKRICLPLEKEARERVMREVRALAKLDHAGIVRYYNAWLETPPDEWLKQHDALLGIVHTRDGLSFPSTDGICENNYSNLNNTNDFNIGDKFGESGDISNLDYYGNTKSPFDTRRRQTGYSSDYLKENSSSPSLDIVFEGSGSIRLEAENNTEESEINKVASSGLQLEKVYLYIQMQLCRKDTLKDWLRTNCENRDKTTIFDFFYQIVDAVEYVHSQDLIHRDLKPSNIFFSLDGTLKIGDFGLCRAKTNTCVGSSLDLKEYAADFSDAVHTEQVGTQLYMSPEQMNGLSYNHKVDIFAMGLILLELLVPFKTQMQRVNVLLKARTNMFSRDFKRDHPDEHELVRSLLDRRPHKRPTASAIKEHDLLANAQLSQPVIERIYHRRRTISSNSSSE